MTRKITALFLSAALVLTAGVAVAYYNTRTLGFDSEATVFEKSSDKVRFLDFEIYYDDVKRVWDGVSSYLPDTAIPIEISANES